MNTNDLDFWGLSEKDHADARAEDELRLGDRKELSDENLPTFDQMYAFLREHYLHSRFEGRDTPAWNFQGRYPDIITRAALNTLKQTGVGFIGPYEAASGRVIKYDAKLNVLNPDAPREQLGKQSPNLTHIYGQSI